MEDNIKTIGVLTSGGDAPGMNAAIRAVTRSAIKCIAFFSVYPLICPITYLSVSLPDSNLFLI